MSSAAKRGVIFAGNFQRGRGIPLDTSTLLSVNAIDNESTEIVG
jgi:hypothetical protein